MTESVNGPYMVLIRWIPFTIYTDKIIYHLFILDDVSIKKYPPLIFFLNVHM